MSATQTGITPESSNAVSGPQVDLQILTFFVNGSEYAVDILSVQEIRSWAAPMPIPHAPDYITGVINIRGEIVPIVDLRRRLGFPDRAPDGTTVIVVLRDRGTTPRVLGVVVDAMSDVANVPAATVRPLPVQSHADVTMGIVALTDKMIGLLNPGLLLPARNVPGQ